MLRTIFVLGVLALLGLFVLKLFFGIFGFLFGLLKLVIATAIPILVIGLVVYVVIRIVSPDTARRLRESISGRSS